MYFDFTQYKQKGFAVLWMLVTVLVTAGVTGGAFYLGRVITQKPEPQNIVTSQAQPETTIIDDKIANWGTYRDEKHKFEFRYPKSWIDNYGEDLAGFVIAEYDLLPSQKDYDPKSGMPAPINTKEEFLEQKSIIEKGILPPEYASESRLIKSLKISGKPAVQYYSLSLSGGVYLIKTTVFTNQLRIDINKTLPLNTIYKPSEENSAIMTMDDVQSIIRLDELADGKFNREVEKVIQEYNLALSTFKFL